MSTLTMFDLRAKFNSFYTDCVKLSDAEIYSLREKKRLNVDRLKEGLSEYNSEHNTNYRIVEDIEQGSVAMRTVTQHDKKEYDIDVAVVFEATDIPENPRDVKAIVEDALQRKCTRFKAAPKAKTNAVTVEYASGYHIDFAIYRRKPGLYGGNVYEHCGSEWRERDPRAINSWFKGRNDDSNNNIRKVVRILKMFCKSNSGWLMPGGLVQSILVAEQVQNRERLDEMFYETIKAIKNRLNYYRDVCNPTLGQSILYNKKDEQKVNNLYKRLESGIDKLQILFQDDCNEEDAMNAWKGFFNHSFWGTDIQKSTAYAMLESKNTPLIGLNINVYITDRVVVPFNEFGGRIPKGSTIRFSAEPRVPYTKVEWVVHNYGDEAEADTYHKKEGKSVVETTKYRGDHTMTCRIYEGERIVAQEVILVSVR
ncbi:nucleotidyltransferase [Bacillus infantis]|uniref:nucleotidyltransferase n=1 Tax=Bacillus infantis TaxID=324767 RepID=UPI001CD756D1|nr:nucleotidyltransferase [Bacillus infantis]MCA1042418.1 nucleotidyltransferase [Bacillus infantis]